MKMKKIFLTCCLFMAIVLCFGLIAPYSLVRADGDANANGGGNANLGEGSHNNQWIPGEEGVRVTVVDADTGTAKFQPIDLTNSSVVLNRTDIYSYKKYCKLTYLTGAVSLTWETNYKAFRPNSSLPRIISSESLGKSDIEEIKSYFTDNNTLSFIASKVGITFDELVGPNDDNTGSKYRIVIEPIMYFWFGGNYYGMTAHEFFLTDLQTNGALRAYFRTLAYTNLAYSMFLEYGELGVPAWPNGTSSAASITEGIRYLGIGIIHFTAGEQPNDSEFEVSSDPYVYRCDTDVITSITVSSSVDVTPKDPIVVTFYINGHSYQVNNVVLPGGESQLVWCKWHTPDTPQNITGYAEVSGGGQSETITIPIVIEELVESTPPDPKPTDEEGKAIQKPSDWNYSDTTGAMTQRKNKIYSNSQTLSWGVWVAIANIGEIEHEDTYTYTDENGIEHEETDTWIEYYIYYTYEEDRFYASLGAMFDLTPDTYCPTARGDTMGSGYGVNADFRTFINGIYYDSMVTSAQNCRFWFPEFYYKTYFRVGELYNPGRFEFRQNKYSTFNSRTHFTPLWYPDGQMNYEVLGEAFDCWTPAGMLTCEDQDSVNIKGTVYDDWTISEVLD